MEPDIEFLVLAALQEQLDADVWLELERRILENANRGKKRMQTHCHETLFAEFGQ